MAGSGIGTFVLAPLTDWLLRRFLWRGALVVCSAILLNIVVCGAVYRPLRSPAAAARRRMSSAPDLVGGGADAGSAGVRRAVLGHARWSAADVAAFITSRLGRSRADDVAGSADAVTDQSSSSAVSSLV